MSRGGSEKGGCQEQAPTITANYLACRLLLIVCKRVPGWGKRETKKWEMWQRDPPLADWYPKGSVSRWELILVSVLCAASRAPVVSVQS